MRERDRARRAGKITCTWCGRLARRYVKVQPPSDPMPLLASSWALLLEPYHGWCGRKDNCVYTAVELATIEVSADEFFADRAMRALGSGK